MRVLVVTNMWPSEERPALGRFVRDQVEALRDLEGIDVEVFAFEPGGGPRGYAAAARRLRRAHGGGGFDVVHAHYGLTAWVARALGGAPLVVTFHGTDLEHRAVGPLSRAVARLADLPATVSAGLARRALPGAGRTLRAAVLPCGVDLDRFRPAGRAQARARLGLDPGARYLLFPADPVRPEKRHDRARELSRAAGAELLTYRSTDPDDVPDHVNAADAVVVTSEREGFGLACLEALACDVPVLATDTGIAPVALHGVDGAHCGPFDLEAWTEIVRGHLTAPDPRIEGRARAALFDRRRMAARVACAYADLVGRGATSGAEGVSG